MFCTRMARVRSIILVVGPAIANPQWQPSDGTIDEPKTTEADDLSQSLAVQKFA